MQVAVDPGEAGHARRLFSAAQSRRRRHRRRRGRADDGGVPGHGSRHRFHDRAGVAGRRGQLDDVESRTWMGQSGPTPAGEPVAHGTTLGVTARTSLARVIAAAHVNTA